MSDIRLDHVALAVWRWSDARSALVDRLGARFLGGVRMAEYSPCQLGFGNGMRVELLEPGTDSSSFLARFLARSGPGPHHVTFKVDDIRVAIKRARDAGLQIVRERLDNPSWQEAFLHPSSTGIGFVIQLAQADINPGSAMASAPGSVSPADSGLAPAPAAGPAEAASIPFFTATVRDLGNATALLTEVLHGKATDGQSDGGVRYREVSWQAGTARIVLTETTSDPQAATPQAGIQALAVTASAATGFPAESHIDGWDVTPVLPELGIRLLTKLRLAQRPPARQAPFSPAAACSPSSV